MELPASEIDLRGPLILAIDQGTTGTTALVVTPSGAVLSRHNREFPQHFPRPGWVEHEPEEIWQSVLSSCAVALDAVPGSRERLAAIGITNQRETMLVWDASTAIPVGRALVWQDRRTAGHCEELVAAGYAGRVRNVTGLIIDPYFSATKLAWVLDSVPGLRHRAEARELQFGTIDSFLIKRLAGGQDAPHVIEVTNASRTLLMDLRKRQFSEEMCDVFGVPMQVLPKIVPSAGEIARTRGVQGIPDGIPITGVAGDQHAALFGQGCFGPGDVKCTYGTGAFVLMNTGAEPTASSSGLLTTLAWQIGDDVSYALEGSCFIAGAAVQWLRDGLGLLPNAPAIEELARSVESSDGVVFVPALSGLGAPHWDPEATGLITGLTRGTTRAHLARATLEAIACQVDDLLRAMDTDLRAVGNGSIGRLRVDGGASSNDLLMEMQAGISGIEVARPRMTESTARGAAMLAAVGVGLVSGAQEVGRSIELERVFGGAGQEYLGMTERSALRRRWEAALCRARTSGSGD